MEPNFLKNNLEKYLGQKILIFKSGGTHYSSGIHNPETHFNRKALIGTLIEKKIEDEILKAIIKKPSQINFSKENKNIIKISLDPFIETPSKRKNYDFFGHTGPSGLCINIYHNPQEIEIGGTTKYEENPCRILRIGNQTVDNFIRTMKLKF